MPRPRELTYFADRSLDSPTFVEPLLAAGYEVERFGHQPGLDPVEDSDALWIRLAAERRWIALSGDRSIGSNPEEIDEVMQSGAVLFVLTFGRHTNHALLAENFLRTAHRIPGFLARYPAPFIAKINRPNTERWERGEGGDIRIFRTHEQWAAHRHRRRSRWR